MLAAALGLGMALQLQLVSLLAEAYQSAKVSGSQ